jgi:hypothetical protein
VSKIYYGLFGGTNIFKTYFKYNCSKYIRFICDGDSNDEDDEDDECAEICDNNENGLNDKIYYERTNYYDLIDKTTLFSKNIVDLFGLGPYTSEKLSARFRPVNCYIAALESNIKLLDWVHEGGICSNAGNLDCALLNIPKIMSDMSRQWIDKKVSLCFLPYQIRTIKDKSFDIKHITKSRCSDNECIQYQHDEGFAINIRNVKNWQLIDNQGILIGITKDMVLYNKIIKPLEQKYGKLKL